MTNFLSSSFKVLLPLVGTLGIHYITNVEYISQKRGNSFFDSADLNEITTTVETLYFSKSATDAGTCWKMDIKVLETTNGTTVVRHHAAIETGAGCDGAGRVLLSETFDKQASPEFVVIDDNFGKGTTKNYFATHNNDYKKFEAQKEEIIRLLP